MAAALGDQSQRALRHHALIVEPAPATDRRDVAVLVRLVVEDRLTLARFGGERLLYRLSKCTRPTCSFQ